MTARPTLPQVAGNKVAGPHSSQSGYDVAPIRLGLETAVRFRRDNACYLREQFPGAADLAHAADLFERAAGRYQMTLDAVADGIGDLAEARQIAAWLREAAVAEREVGQIFQARGQPASG